MKLSYSTWGMPGVPIATAIAHCAALGFDGLELAVIPGWTTDAATLSPNDRRRIRSYYDDHAIDLCGLSGNVALMAGSADERDRAIDQFHSYLDLASELQKPGEALIVTTTSAGKPGDWDVERNEIAERFGALANYAAERGVRVGVEPHVATALHLPNQAIWLMNEIGSDALTIHFDISHFNVQGIAMEESISLLAPICHHTHIKDERGIAPAHEFLIPGEGEMNYPLYLRLMRDAGYDGHIVVEISLMAQQRPEYDPLAAATRSYEVVNAAFDAAGISRTR